MSSIRNPFKRDGVPPSEQALAALGVKKATKGLERERKGAKGLDEIGLSEEELSHAEVAERLPGAWSKERLIDWVSRCGLSNNPEDYIEDRFQIESDGAIKYKRDFFDVATFHNADKIRELPAHFRVNDLHMELMQIQRLPKGLVVKQLFAGGSRLVEIPADLVADYANFEGTAIREIPAGLQVKFIDLRRTVVRKIPPGNKIETIALHENQVELIESAKQRGIDYHIYA